MPVVTVASSKGGSGKSTTALLFCLALAERGARVLILDCDPNKPLVRWHGASRKPLDVAGDITDGTLLPLIDREATIRDLLLIDVEGTAGRLVARAIARSDLVIIPTMACALDTVEAHRTVALVREEEQLHRRAIPYRVALSRTGMIQTREEKAIIRELDAKGIPRLRNALAQRVAFQSVFARRCTLNELPVGEVSGVEQAKANVEAFANEVEAVLRAGREGGRQHELLRQRRSPCTG